VTVPSHSSDKAALILFTPDFVSCGRAEVQRRRALACD